MERLRHLPAMLTGLALVAVACTPLPMAQASDVPEPRAVRIADALAEAEAAHDTGANERLSLLVSALQASGTAPRDQAETDMVAQWSQTAGLQTIPYRGRLLGPAYVRGELAPGESWRSAQTFKSGVPSTLAVSHKGAGPVRMKVSDQRERLVCAPGNGAKPACRFTPLYTQRYDIELINEGVGRAVYYLVFD